MFRLETKIIKLAHDGYCRIKFTVYESVDVIK